MQCCLGPFEITALDAVRLREGLARLAETDGTRAEAVRARATGYAGEDDEACPALNPESGTCELYGWRPVTCREFGPAIKGPDGKIGACELCYVGASDEEISTCAVGANEAGIGLESRLVAELVAEGLAEKTTVAEALNNEERRGSPCRQLAM